MEPALDPELVDGANHPPVDRARAVRGRVSRIRALPRSGRYALVGIGAYALIAATARPLTVPATVAVLLPGLVLVWRGVRRAPRNAPPVGVRSAVVWVGLAAIGCLWELFAMLWGNDAAHPTISLLADPLFATYPGRIAGYALWLGLGAWLVTR